MRPHFVIFAAICVLGVAGCAGRQTDIQCPRAQENPSAWSQCWDNMKAEGSAKAKTAGTYAGEGVDTFLAYMKRVEKYLETKIEDWKASNPELVEVAEKRLESVRAKIREYEKRVSAVF